MVSDLTDRLGPKILTVLEIEGQVLHSMCRECTHLKNEFLFETFAAFCVSVL